MKEYKIPAEIYSRVSGYFRPVTQWNRGKRGEFAERKMLDLSKNMYSEITSPGKNIKANSQPEL